MNDEAVYRTAPASPSLLIILVLLLKIFEIILCGKNVIYIKVEIAAKLSKSQISPKCCSFHSFCRCNIIFTWYLHSIYMTYIPFRIYRILCFYFLFVKFHPGMSASNKDTYIFFIWAFFVTVKKSTLNYRRLEEEKASRTEIVSFGFFPMQQYKHKKKLLFLLFWDQEK